MKRRTLAEAVAETRAMAPRRKAANVRISRAKREALAPQPPAAALMAYSGVMDTYAARVKVLVDRHILSALPVAGSGESLPDMGPGLLELQTKLDALAARVERSAMAAGKRVSVHGRREAGRMMRVVIPNDIRSDVSIVAFAQNNIQALRKIGRAQVDFVRASIAEYKDGNSLRADIEGTLWVARNRAKLLARDQVQKFHAQTIQEWSLAAGSRRFIWCTVKDERTRPGHSELDGKTFEWANPPSTGGREGNNLPGQAIFCRCASIPVEAL